jgi:hypothetical protein
MSNQTATDLILPFNPEEVVRNLRQEKLMVSDINAVLGHAQTIVIGTKDPEFRTVPSSLRPVCVGFCPYR